MPFNQKSHAGFFVSGWRSVFSQNGQSVVFIETDTFIQTRIEHNVATMCITRKCIATGQRYLFQADAGILLYVVRIE